jgi:hypothetical protein
VAGSVRASFADERGFKQRLNAGRPVGGDMTHQHAASVTEKQLLAHLDNAANVAQPKHLNLDSCVWSFVPDAICRR